MKKIWLVLILFLLILSACDNQPDWQISFKQEPFYKKGVQAPFVVDIMANSKAATELTVIASFEMKTMNHGAVEIELNERSPGVYEGLVELPMPGDYAVFLTMDNGSQQIEELISLKVE